MRRLSGALCAVRWPWWLGVAVWAAVLYLLSDNSAPQTGPEFPFKDKVLHCIYFSGGAFCFTLACLAGQERRMGLLIAMLLGLAFAALIGALDEWHQSFTPGRMGNDLGDWLADSTGGLLGSWLAWRWLQALRLPSEGRSPM